MAQWFDLQLQLAQCSQLAGQDPKSQRFIIDPFRFGCLLKEPNLCPCISMFFAEIDYGAAVVHAQVDNLDSELLTEVAETDFDRFKFRFVKVLNQKLNKQVSLV